MLICHIKYDFYLSSKCLRPRKHHIPFFVQARDLRYDMIERDQLLEALRHQRKVTDVMTRLKDAELLRRLLELQYLKRKKNLERWNSFGGLELCHREVS